jgi:hypothetical protein
MNDKWRRRRYPIRSHRRRCQRAAAWTQERRPQEKEEEAEEEEWRRHLKRSGWQAKAVMPPVSATISPPKSRTMTATKGHHAQSRPPPPSCRCCCFCSSFSCGVLLCGEGTTWGVKGRGAGRRASGVSPAAQASTIWTRPGCRVAGSLRRCSWRYLVTRDCLSGEYGKGVVCKSR